MWYQGLARRITKWAFVLVVFVLAHGAPDLGTICFGDRCETVEAAR